MMTMTDSGFNFDHFVSLSDESDPDIEVERLAGRVNSYQFEMGRAFRFFMVGPGVELKLATIFN